MSARKPQTSRWVQCCSLAGVLAGAGGMQLFAWELGLLAWASTSVIVGAGLGVLVGTTIVLTVASPLRARGRVWAAAHGAACGVAWWWVGLAVLGADLHSRHDRLFVAWLSCCLIVIAAKLSCGTALVYGCARWSLLRNPRGNGPLECIRAMYLAPAGARDAPESRRVAMWWLCGKSVRVGRRVLGLASWRSHAIERAIEDSLDAAAAKLRRASERGRGVGTRSRRMAYAVAAELDLHRVLNELQKRSPSDNDRWIPRVAVAWDLLRHASRRSSEDLSLYQDTILKALEQTAERASPLAEAARSCNRSEVNTRQIDRFASTTGPAFGGLEFLAAIVTGDALLDVELAGWAVGLIDAVGRRGAPSWGRPSLARLRLTAESMILRHERWIEPPGAAARRVRSALAAVAADAPELARAGGRDGLPASLRRVRVPAVRRGTRQFSGVKRPGPDNGPGRAMTILGLGVTVAGTVWVVTGFHPLGNPTKRLNDLYRTPHLATSPLSSADLDPKTGTLVLGSKGGGVHLISTKSFRVQTERAGTGGLSSNWVSGVSVDSSGAIAAQTLAQAASNSGDRSAGLDVRLANGRWKTLIAANQVEGLDGKDLTAIIGVGADKVLILGSRLVRYSSGTRGLVELRPASPGVALDSGESFTAASSAQDASGRFWIASKHGRDNGTLGSLWEVQIQSGATYSAVKEMHAPLQDEGVVQIAVQGGSLLVRTAAQRLYEKTQQGWRLLLDADSDLDLSRIGNVALVDGQRPGVWMTEVDPAGDLRGLRFRLLRAGSAVPDGPWFHGDLHAGIRTSSGTLLHSHEVALGTTGSAVAAWWDASKGEHVLLAAGTQTGLVCFRAATSTPTSVADALVVADTIPTDGERVVWLDSFEGRLLLVLESTNGDRKRVVWRLVEGLSAQGLSDVHTVQQSSRPDNSLIGDAKMLSLRVASAERRVEVVTDRGRIMTYDQALRGWISSRGVELQDPDGKPIGQLASADLTQDQLVVVATDGRVFQSSRSTRAAESASLPMLLIHRPTAASPSATEEPVRVATEPDGVVLFMGQGTGAVTAQPWSFCFGAGITGAVVGWKQERVETNRPISVESLTRLQLEGRIGPLIAIDDSGTLVFRSSGVWRPVRGIATGWSRTLAAVGGTFVQGEAGIALVEGSAGQPAVSSLLWTRQNEVVQLPISAVAALRRDGNVATLVVGHRGGIAGYDPATRMWAKIIDGGRAEEPETNGAWELHGKEGSDGTCAHLWAMRQAQNGLRDVVLVRPGSAIRPVDGAFTSTSTAGDGLAVVRQDGELLFLTPSGEARSITGPLSKEIGNANITRACVGPDGNLWVVDDRGRLLRLHGPQMSAELVTVPGLNSVIREIACAENGELVILTETKRVHRWLPSTPQLESVPMLQGTELIQTVGGTIAAASPVTGRLTVVGKTGDWIAAGGMTGDARLGQLSGVLGDGDWLWASGTAGMVGRDPERRMLVPVRDAVGVRYIERVGDSIIAWCASGPRVVRSSENGFVSVAPPFPVSSVLAAPGGGLVGLSCTADGPALRGFMQPGPADERLFGGDAKLSDKIETAAPLGSTTAVLKGANGALLSYDLGSRSLSLLARSTDLPALWDLKVAGTRVCVVPSQSPLRGDISIVEDGRGIRKVGRGARSVLQTPKGVSWIQEDGAVMTLGEHGDAKTLSTVAMARPVLPRALDALIADSKGILWWSADGVVAGYNGATGRMVGPAQAAKGLGIVQGKAIGVVDAGTGFHDIVALSNREKLNRARHRQVALGGSTVLGWSLSGDSILAEYLGDASFQVSRQVVAKAPLLDLSSRGAWVAIDGRFVYFRSKSGSIELYDATTGEWRSVTGGPWTALGRVGAAVVGLRASKDGDVLDFFESGDVSARRSAVIKGDALFAGERYVELRMVNAATAAAGFVSYNGAFEEAAVFTRFTEPFSAAGSVAIDLTDKEMSLVGLAAAEGQPRDRWLLASAPGDRAQPIHGIPADLATRVVSAARFGDSVVIWGGPAGVAVIRAETGHVVRVASDCGVIGSDAWTLGRDEAGTLRVLRVRDGAALESQLGLSELPRFTSRSDGAFRLIDGQNVLVLQTSDGEGAAAAEYLAVGMNESRFGVTIQASLRPGQEQPLKTPGTAATKALRLLGRTLEEDGWFSDRRPVRVSRSDRDQAIALTMRDGSTLDVRMKVAVAAAPTPSLGDFQLREGQLGWRNSPVVFGTPSSGKPMPADLWQSAMPVDHGRFYSIDAVGQLWWWSEPGATKRIAVGLPAPGVAESLALRATGQSNELVVLGKGGVFLGVVADGKLVGEAQNGGYVEGPARRDGALGPLQWRRSKSAMELFVRLKDEESRPLDFILGMSLDGLDTDHPLGLCQIPQDSGIWFELGSTASGRTVVCPADQNPGSRVGKARTVAKLLPAPAANEFSVGSLHFMPITDAWRVDIGGTAIPILGGRFAIDLPNRAATLQGQDVLELWFLTDLSGFVVRQSWGNKLGPPELVPLPANVQVNDLRTKAGLLFVNVTDMGWLKRVEGGWERSQPDWTFNEGAPTKWRYSAATGRLSYAEEAVDLLETVGGAAFAADVLTRNLDMDGSARIRANANGVAFESSSGAWYLARLDMTIAQRLQKPPELEGHEVVLAASKASVPKRSSAGGSYALVGTAGASVQLPWRLMEGRLPHNAVENVRRWTGDGVEAGLVDSLGYRQFEGLARESAWPTVSIDLVPEPSPSQDLAVHTGVSLAIGSRLSWHKQDQTFALKLDASETASAGIASSAIGMLGTLGNPIDDPANVRPVGLRNGRLAFVYADQMWSMSPGGGVSSCAPRPNSGVPGIHAVLDVDRDSGGLMLRDTPSTASDLAPLVLGRFVDDGKWDGEHSVRATLAPGSADKLGLQGFGGTPFDITVERGGSGWRFPGEYAKAIAVDSKDSVCLLGDDGRTTSRWVRQPDRVWAWAGAGPFADESGVSIWREGDRVVVGFGRPGSPRMLDVRDGHWPVCGSVTTVAERLFDAASGSFAFRRQPADGTITAFFTAQGELRPILDPWRELPGCRIDRACWCSREDLVFQDKYGIERVGEDEHQVWPLVGKSTLGLEEPSLQRFMGVLVMGLNSARPSTLAVEGSGYGIRMERSGDNLGRQVAGRWEFRQKAPGTVVAVEAMIEGEVEHVMLGGGDDEAARRRRSLLIDRCTCLVDEGRGVVRAVTPMGSWVSGNPGPLIPFSEVARLVASQEDLGVLRSEDGGRYAGVASTTKAVDPASGRVVDAGSLKTFMYFGEGDDWRVSRDVVDIELQRSARVGGVRVVDLLRGAELFSHGQFAFDHVEDIWFDTSGSGKVMVQTLRAREALSTSEDGVSLNFVELAHPRGTLAAGGERRGMASPRAAGAVIRESVEGPETWRCSTGDVVLKLRREQPTAAPDAETLAPVVPQSFVVAERLWVVFGDGVYWLETAGRWKAKRILSGVQEPDTPRNASEKAGSD